MSVYTSALTAQDTSAQTLTVNEQYALITDVQNVPTTVEILEDGSEYVTYGVTPASEAAGAKLLAAFWPAIIGAARKTKLAGQLDDAEGVALEEFVRAVREYDLTSDTPFHHTIKARLERAVQLADRVEASAVTVPAVQVARYYRLLHAHDLDATRAAEAAAADPGKWLLTGASFLAVHAALSRPNYHGNGHGDGQFRDERANESVDPFAALDTPAPSPEEDVLDREYARWLLAQTSDRQESICRLAYGFQDHASDTARLDHGYREGDVLDDSQVADCLDLTRPTVQRERSKALKTMRAAAEAAIADEIA